MYRFLELAPSWEDKTQNLGMRGLNVGEFPVYAAASWTLCCLQLTVELLIICRARERPLQCGR